MLYRFRNLFGWDMLLVISICGYLWFIEMPFLLHTNSDALQFVTIYAFLVGLVILTNLCPVRPVNIPLPLIGLPETECKLSRSYQTGMGPQSAFVYL